MSMAPADRGFTQQEAGAEASAWASRSRSAIDISLQQEDCDINQAIVAEPMPTRRAHVQEGQQTTG